MRTLSLNLDFADAEILREALEAALVVETSGLHEMDEREASLRATLNELIGMIERPAPRRRRSVERTLPTWRPSFVPAPEFAADAE